MTTQQAELSRDLYRFIIDAFYEVPAPERRLSHWVMNAEWRDEVRQMSDGDGVPYWRPGHDLLMGLPYVVRDDGGVPHLEPDAVPRERSED